MGLFGFGKKPKIKMTGMKIYAPSDKQLKKQFAEEYQKNKPKIKKEQEKNRSAAKPRVISAEQKKQKFEEQLSEFKKINVVHYVVSTSSDQRVCEKCKKHDKKKYSVSKAKIGVNFPPFCENCRCVVLPCFKGMKMPWG